MIVTVLTTAFLVITLFCTHHISKCRNYLHFFLAHSSQCSTSIVKHEFRAWSIKKEYKALRPKQ